VLFDGPHDTAVDLGAVIIGFMGRSDGDEAVAERRVVDGGHAVWNGQGSELGAVCERTLADLDQSFGKVDRGEGSAAHERVVADEGHAARDSDRGQAFTVQKSTIFQNADILKENGNRKTVKLKNAEYLGVPISDIGLAFNTNGVRNTAGLVTVIVHYEEEYEKTLLTKLEELYGVRKNAYTDKNGVENPINPAGWVSNETIEGVFTEEEKEYYISMFPKDYDQTRLDANLRSPLASIRFDEERNLIQFNGSDAAIVSYIKAEIKK